MSDGTVIAGAILDHMSDAVVVVDEKGAIVTINPAARNLLGVGHDQVAGSSLAALLLHDERNDDLMQVILDAVYEGGAARRAVAPYVRGGVERTLAVTTSRLDTPGGRKGVIAVLADITETLTLRARERALGDELKANAAKLQAAYLGLERQTARDREAAGRRRRTWRLAAGVGAAVAVVVAASLLIRSSVFHALPSAGQENRAASPADGETPSTLLVEPRPLATAVSFVGVLEPGSTLNATAMFDATVEEIRFVMGSRVERGDVLVVLDDSQLRSQLRDAQAALIRAEQEYETLKTWQASPDVARAKRSLESAEFSLADARRKAEQTKALLDRGIVAASEHEQLVQQIRSQELQLASSRQDYQSTLDRGRPQLVSVARLGYENALGRFRELEAQMAGREVRAPVAGIALRPAATGGGEGDRRQELAVGARVTRGQALLSVGNLEQFLVRGQIDELGINAVAVGQPVEAQSETLAGPPLRGKVAAVSFQAKTGQRRLPSFDVLVTIDSMTPEQRARLRIGMSAAVSITTYANPKAIVLPLAAVSGQGGSAMVQVLRGGSTVPAPVKVRLGLTTLDGIEVVEGLAAGDRVVLPAGSIVGSRP